MALEPAAGAGWPGRLRGTEFIASAKLMPPPLLLLPSSAATPCARAARAPHTAESTQSRAAMAPVERLGRPMAGLGWRMKIAEVQRDWRRFTELPRVVLGEDVKRKREAINISTSSNEECQHSTSQR